MDIAYLQILLLLLQCTIIAVLLLFLFRLRTIFGLSLLLITLGVFQFIQVFLTSTLSIEIYSGYQVSPGSMVLFTGSLFAILLVYLREDALKARKIIYALFIANGIIGLLLLIFSYLINDVFINNVYNLPVEFYSQNTKIIFVGTALLLLDGYAIVFLYEFLSKYVKWLFLKMLLTMVIVLSIDALFFAVGVFGGTENFQLSLISGIASKSLAALVYSAIFAVYLIYIEKKSIDNIDDHASFSDLFRALTFREKYEDVLEKMRIKTEELQETQDIAQLGSYVLNFKTNAFESSGVFDRICGLNDNKLKTHEYYRNIIHPDDLELNDHYYLESIRTKKPYNRKYRIYRNNDHELRWISEQGRAIYNKGEPVQFKGTIQDITDQKFNEFALKKQNEELNNLSKELSVKNELLLESERKFKNLFSKSPISLWEEDFSIVKKLIDQKKTKTNDFAQYLNDNPDFVAECLTNIKILNVNDVTLELLGVTTKEELITQLGKSFNVKSYETLKKELIALAEGKKEFAGETQFTRSDGEIITTIIKYVIVNDDYSKAILSIVDITELIQAKEKIEESEKKFRELFEKSGDAILIIKNEIFIECNQATIEMLEYNTKDEFLQTHPSKLSPEVQPDGKDSFIKAQKMMNISLEKGTHRFEWIHTKSTGENFPVEVLLTAIVNEPENKVIHCVWRDITERKKAELTLLESEAALKNAQEIAQLGSYNLDLQTNIFSSSYIFDSIVGFKSSDVKTLETWRTVVHPKDLEENKKLLAHCIKTKSKFNREYRIINKKTKDIKWLHALGEIRYKGTIPLNFVGTIQDITKRKLNELAISLNEKKLIEIQKIANLGTYEIDLKTNIVSASSIYKSILGIKKTPKNNKGWWKSITHPDDYKNSELLWQECITNCKIYEDEYRIINDKKEIKWIYDLAEVKCENGIPSKVVGTIQDITSRKFSEERIRRSNAIINQITSLIQVVDKKGNITYASPSFKTVLGYEPEEILGLGWWIKTTPDLDTAYKLRDDILNNVRNNAPLTDEIKNRWITTKDGKPKLFDWISSKGEEDSLIFIGIDVTEKIIADLNIVQYWKIVEDSLNEIYIFDAETFKFIEVNRGARENIGYSLMELKKMTPIDLKPMYTKHLFNELIDPLKSGAKNRIVFNTIHKRKNGTQYTAEIHLQKSEINQKEVYIAFVKDITLQEHEENIKQVLFNITKRSSDNIRLKDFFYFIKNELGKLINTNNFFIALYDDKTDMISTPFMIDEFDEGTDFPKGETLTGHVIDTKKALLTSEKFVSYTAEGKKVIGLGPESKCWLGVPLLIDDIAIGAIVVQSYTDENAYTKEDVAILELVASNIAQLIQKTEDFEKIQLLNQGLIQSSHGVIITNLQGEIEYTNPAFTELTGYTEKEAIGKNPRMLKSGKHLEAFYTNLYDTILTGKTWYGELTNKHKDGHKYLIDANISSVKNMEGKMTHYIMIFEDITTKRQLERQFINAFIDAQEVEKQNFGEELHDGISQILSAESMYIDLLIEQNQDRINDKARFLTKIKELNLSAVNETRNIAHGLMSSQLKQSGLLVAAENICIDFNLVKNIKFNFFKKGINEEDISKEIKTNLFRIIQELTTNINRYSSATKASIEFRKLDHNKLKLTVKDNGIGMDYNKIKKERKVTGLQNVERRITFLNGTYKVESGPNKGTTWHITVPL